MTRVGFISEANEQVGFGHLYRCIALGQEFVQKNFEVLFFLSSKNEKEITLKMIPTAKIIKREMVKNYIEKRSQYFSYIIIDVFHKNTLEYSYLQNIDSPITVMIIDDVYFEQSLRTDIVFKIGYQDFKQNEISYKWLNGKKTKCFSGTDFFIFREEFKKEFNFICNIQAKKIIVTMGGSDPFRLSEFVADALTLIDYPLFITFVLGSGFSNERLKKLKVTLHKTIHAIEYKKNVINMAELMASNDVAIINGGTTRFELALIGVPFLSISFNQTQQNISERISNNGIGKALGIGAELHPQIIASEIQFFLNNNLEREKMSAQMKKIFKMRKESLVIEKILKSNKNE